MKKHHIFFIILALYGLLWLPGLLMGSAYLDTPFGLVAILPFLSVYLLDMIGIPGLLQNNGACGWGWCAPTLFGWVFVAALWLGAVYLLSTGLARLGEMMTCPNILNN